MTIQQLTKDCVKKYSGHTAFQMRVGDGWQRITFRETAELIPKIQSALVKFGVAHGDRVVLISENRPEWPIAYLAICSMGAVAVPLDAMLSKDEIFTFIIDSGAKAIILSSKLAGYLKGTAFDNVKIVMEYIPQLRDGQDHSFKVEADDLAAIVYTSGTTGNPKGVMLTHHNIMSNVTAVGKLFDLGPGDNFLSVLPLHHTFETTAGFLGAFSLGCTITYTESLKSYNLLRNMQETGVTVMCGVPLLYQLLLDGIMREVEAKNMDTLFNILRGISNLFLTIIGINIGKYLFSIVHNKFGGKIRFFVSGGAALDPSIIKEFNILGLTLLQGYGLTESSPILTCCTLQHNKVGSVGRAIEGVKLKIAGSAPVGEILASGPNIMRGYYRRKDLTNEVIKQGWLSTGDVGYLDEDGYLFITGRNKDVIVTGSGVNVYPEELELLLNKIGQIKEACVLGAKIREGLRRGGEEAAAVIVPNEGADEEEIKTAIACLNLRLPEYKRIARVILRRQDLPKTRLLKVKKHLVRKEMGII
ncbi:MAG: AMP-binding protein [Candidatus Margulisbacteria bacterium]|nr:AMP-binding protein [Candidatus Margulisiibacteriota bacterium]